MRRLGSGHSGGSTDAILSASSTRRSKAVSRTAWARSMRTTRSAGRRSAFASPGRTSRPPPPTGNRRFRPTAGRRGRRTGSPTSSGSRDPPRDDVAPSRHVGELAPPRRLVALAQRPFLGDVGVVIGSSDALIVDAILRGDRRVLLACGVDLFGADAALPHPVVLGLSPELTLVLPTLDVAAGSLVEEAGRHEVVARALRAGTAVAAGPVEPPTVQVRLRLPRLGRHRAGGRRVLPRARVAVVGLGPRRCRRRAIVPLHRARFVEVRHAPTTKQRTRQPQRRGITSEGVDESSTRWPARPRDAGSGGPVRRDLPDVTPAVVDHAAAIAIRRVERRFQRSGARGHGAPAGG